MSRDFALRRRLVLPAAAIVLLVGCSGNSGMNAAQNAVKSMEQLTTLLKSVQDAPSASVAVGKIKPAFAEFSVALKEIAAYEKEHGQVRGLKTQVSQLEQDLARLKMEMAGESQRLESLRGLPPEFWNELRMASAQLDVDLIDAMAIQAGLDPALAGNLKSEVEQVRVAYEQHGPERVAKVTIRGGRDFDHEEAIERLRNLAGSGATLATVADLDDTGETNLMIAPVADMQAFRDSIDFGTVVDFIPERCEITLEVTEELAGPFAGMTDEERAEHERIAAEQAEYERRQAEETERQAAESRQREEEAERERLAEEERQRPPTPGAADYHQKLLTNLRDPQAPHHELALDHLLKMKPTDVADAQIRKEIAVAFRELATGDASHRAEAVEGLVLWAGKFAVPVLVKLVEGGAQPLEEAVLAGLGKHPTPEGAKAVAALLKETQQQEAASRALVLMGELAEPPLLEMVPAEEPGVNLAVIKVLGECGTKASLRIMRQAARSENEDIAAAAREAAAKIRQRGDE